MIHSILPHRLMLISADAINPHPKRHYWLTRESLWRGTRTRLLNYRLQRKCSHRNFLVRVKTPTSLHPSSRELDCDTYQPTSRRRFRCVATRSLNHSYSPRQKMTRRYELTYRHRYHHLTLSQLSNRIQETTKYEARVRSKLSQRVHPPRLRQYSDPQSSRGRRTTLRTRAVEVSGTAADRTLVIYSLTKAYQARQFS